MTTKSNDQKYDLRILDLMIRRGEIDPKEYETHLKKLPNDESRAEYIEVGEETTLEEKTPLGGPTFSSG